MKRESYLQGSLNHDFHHSARVHRLDLFSRVLHFIIDALAVIFMIATAVAFAYSIVTPNP